MGNGLRRNLTEYVLKRLLVLLLAFVMAMSYPGRVLADTTSKDLQDANQTKDNIDKKLEETKQYLNQLSSDKTSIQTYIAELDRNLASIDGDINDLSEQISNKELDIQAQQLKLDDVQKKSDEQYETMKLRIKYMYEHGSDTSVFQMLLEAQDMTDFLNKAEYINKITQYDRSMLDELAATAKEIEETKTLLENDYVVLQDMKTEVEGQREALALIQEAKVTELGSLNGKQADAQAYYAQLEKDKAEQEAEIKRIEEELRRQEEEAKKNNNTAGIQKYDGGKFLWPTPSTRITSPWGDMEDRSSPHQGVDIGAVNRGVSGDPIWAAYSGTVVKAEYSNSAGNWIWINHGDGLMTVYMHCSKLLVSVGQKVNKGDTIALMGTTGNSSGVHLHFGVRLNGNYVNPMSYVTK